MRAAAKIPAQIVHEGADIGALGAGHTEMADGLLVAGEAKAEDVNEPFLAFHFNAFARQLVERHAVLLHRGNHGRELHQVADKRGRDFVQLLERQRRDGKGPG